MPLKTRFLPGLISFIILFLCGCYSTKPFYNKSNKQWEETYLPTKVPTYSVYLVGDAGEASYDPIEPTLALLKHQLSSEDPESTAVVYLGDNLYPEGLHKKKHPERAKDEAHLNVQMEAIKDFEGKKYFIPGNHDWKQGKKGGLDFMKRQEDYIEKYFDKNVVRPSNGCPGPESIKLGDDVVLILFDTQWWIHRHKRSEGEKDGCDVSNEAEFIALLKDELRRHRNKKIIVTGHHPLYSNGNHGGNFTWKDHIFPLTAFSEKAYVPLPVVGSIYPMYRKIFGNIQDIPHPQYESLRESLLGLFADHPDLVYACGHEHSLQYTEENQLHHVLTGAGSKDSYVRRNNKIQFGHVGKGYAIVRYYDGGESWLEYYSVEGSTREDKLLFRKQLSESKAGFEVSSAVDTDVSYVGETKKVVPEPAYKASKVKRLIFGKQHRDVWTAAIEVPYLDIHHVHGGLTPIKKGGGMQTQSLRLQGGDGHQYVIRSIQKDPSSTIPRELRNTVANSILHDGISASHPYAAIAVPPMADAVGVYHTNPQLVIVPGDPVLAPYESQFADMLCLFEERPEGDQSHMDSFGNSEEIVGSGDLIFNMQHDHKHFVDQRSMLRARLFDMCLADWDRHDDQWRWATFKYGKRTLYKPIPRDRDQVFFTQDGLVPQISNRRWMIRKFQSFKPEVRDMAGQNFNARYVDRSYLTELSLDDWLQIADSMQSELTDKVIDDALRLMPKPGYDVSGKELAETLKKRRDNLKIFAERYYLILAEEVNVVGSHKDEFFEVIRIDDEQTQVNVFPRKKGKPERDKPLYQRTFKSSETREIHLRVRIIGGHEKDKIVAESKVKGLKNHTIVYDTVEKKKKKRNKIELGTEARDKLVKKSQAITYDREEFKYGSTSPLIWAGFNPDDGIFLGGGVKVIKHGFKKNPYQSMHAIKGRGALATGAFSFDYKFNYPELIGNWDFHGHFDILAPQYLFSFYGVGNESSRGDNPDTDYRLRLNIMDFDLGIKRSRQGLHFISVGPSFQRVDEPTAETPIYDLLPELGDPDDFEDVLIAGVKGEYKLENKDDVANPSRGIRLNLKARYLNDLIGGDVNFTQFSGDLSMYFPINILPGKVTLAMRAGGAHNVGEYAFYQNNFIGGFTEFRGVRRNRFGGRSTFYGNSELRFKLFNWYNYVVPIEFGGLVFADAGRVWTNGGNSDLYHTSYGGGIYVSPWKGIVINGSYGVSDDDEILTILLGFLF
jgi:hypothetical protein